MTTVKFFPTIILLTLILFCKQEPILQPGETYPREILIQKPSPNSSEVSIATNPPTAPNESGSQKHPNLQQITAVLSGKVDSSTDPFLQSKPYQGFKENISKNWDTYHKGILIPFKDWLGDNFKDPYGDTILYPFSGPDIANAITIYPNASKYILIGLEPGGTIPPLESDSAEKKARGLMELNSSMDSISRLNFFLTNKMKINITGAIYPGTTPVILSYLGLMGLEPVSVRAFIIENNGELKYISDSDKLSNPQYLKGNYCSEIQFIDKKSGATKIIYYLSANVSNQGLEKDPGILKFLSARGPFASTFKAASYLLHYDNFKTFREFILDNVNTIVMDDTGPRIKDLKTGFELRVYGIYTRPIALWPNMFQPELKDLHMEQKPGAIPFKYGYGTLHKTQHIIIAKKKSN